MLLTFEYFILILLYWSFSDKEIEKRGLKVAVAGIPKTIDNDIAVSFVVVCTQILVEINIFVLYNQYDELMKVKHKCLC